MKKADFHMSVTLYYCIIGGCLIKTFLVKTLLREKCQGRKE